MSASLINSKAVKALALQASLDNRNGRFTRVGKSFLEQVAAEVAVLVRAKVQRHPSKGKTLL